MSKLVLPKSLIDEAKQYAKLYRENITAVGNVSWTSASSGATYTSAAGQRGIFDQLAAVLADYIAEPPEQVLVGQIKAFGFDWNDPKWLRCDGRLVAVDEYPELAAVLPVKQTLEVVSWDAGFGTDAINALAYGNGMFVAAGAAGKLATSPDGTVWTMRDAGFGTDAINALAYGNGMFVAAGAAGKLATSPDGTVWTMRDAGFGTVSISNTAFGNGKFIACGSAENVGYVASSADGITWNYTSIAGINGASGSQKISDNTGGILFLEDGYIVAYDAVAFSTIKYYWLMYSNDGITWTGKSLYKDMGNQSLLYSSEFSNGAITNTGNKLRYIEYTYQSYQSVRRSNLYEYEGTVDDLVSTWAGRTPIKWYASTHLTELAYGREVSLIGGENTSQSPYTPMLQIYSDVADTISGALSGTPKAIAYGNGRFVIAGLSGTLAVATVCVNTPKLGALDCYSYIKAVE